MVRNRPPPRRARTSVKTPAYHAVSCRRRRASGCISAPSRAEAVARAAQRRDQLGLEVVVDLAAQSRHEHLEDVDERIVVVVPHVRRDRGAVEQASLVQHEQLEQGELLRGEGDLAAAAAYLAGSDVHLEVRHAIERRGERRAAARQRLEPRHELPEGEGLRQVVVGAGLEPAYPVVQGIERREHQHRRGDAAAAQLTAQVEARAVGKADVQDDHIVAAERGLLQAVCDGGRERRIDALRTQAVAQETGQLGIVFYDQYPHSRLRSRYNGRSRVRLEARQSARTTSGPRPAHHPAHAVRRGQHRHGGPPRFRRARAAGARPSRAMPKMTRGVTNRLPLSDASTTSSASAATSAPPPAPDTAAATSPGTRFEAAMRSIGSTWKNAALRSRYSTVTIAIPPNSTRGRVRSGSTTSSAIFATSR